MERIAVVGSRTFGNYDLLRRTLDDVIDPFISDGIGIELVSGGAEGADTLAQKYAKSKGLTITIIYPNWKKFGKSAGFIRNNDILRYCFMLIAFQVNKSKGTQYSIDLAKKAKRNVLVINCDQGKGE